VPNYILSEEDRDDIRRLMEAYRTTTLRHDVNETLLGTPEVYIARIEEGEIDALTEGTAEGEYDHPGFKECDIYKIVYDPDNERYDLIPISNAGKVVFNISGTGISDSWFLVIADKSGNWLAVTGGSGSSLHWGVLGADLEYGDTTGVSVTLDAGGTQAGVLPSKLLESGYYWPSGSKVLIAQIDGDWYVVQGPCPVEMA
jgi:hypothetical protein